MSLCINPSCASAKGQINQGQSLYCRSCRSPLLILDIYRVLKKLGEGGFGKTYLISDHGSQYYVLKILHNQTSKAIELFKQEAEVLKRLNHPGIPKVLHPSPFTYTVYHPQGSSPPLHCLIMEYIEGESLYDYLWKRNFQPISEVAALRWLRQLVEILHLVHGANYFHRDIKPNNIMLNTNGKLVLIDFGTAREQTFTYLQKQQGQKVTGIVSVGYTPFEQQNGSAEPRSDFFALGRTFVFLLTGKTPDNFEDSITQGLQWQGYAQGYAKPLRDFIDKLMQHDVNQRPANTAEILRQIESLEKQLQPQYYGTPTPVKPTQISAPPVMGQLGEITDKIIRSLVSVFWGVISGTGELIGNIMSFVFGGFVHFLKGVWSGWQAIGEFLGSFIISIPWTWFILGLIFYAFIGYLLSPWNREFLIFGFLTLTHSFSLSVQTSLWKNRLSIQEFRRFYMRIKYSRLLHLFVICTGLPVLLFWGMGGIVWPLIFMYYYAEIKGINYLTLAEQLIPNMGMGVSFLIQILIMGFVGTTFVIIMALPSEYLDTKVEYVRSKKNHTVSMSSREINLFTTDVNLFTNIILSLITVALGLGIGWMIYQHFPIVESPPPLLEIWKEFWESSPN